MKTRKDRVITEVTTEHDYTEHRERKTRKTKDGEREVTITTQRSRTAPADNKRKVEIESKEDQDDYYCRTEEGENIQDDIIATRTAESKAREERVKYQQRREKRGELGQERDEDDTGATQRYYERRNGDQDKREDEEDRMCNTTPRTEEEAMSMVQENAKINGNTPTQELRQLRRTRVEETILRR